MFVNVGLGTFMVMFLSDPTVGIFRDDRFSAPRISGVHFVELRFVCWCCIASLSYKLIEEPE